MARIGPLAVLVALAAARAAPAATFAVSVDPHDGEKFGAADFRLWLPDRVRTVRAVIVRQHGCGRAGLDHADDGMWQALAAKSDAALLGTRYSNAEPCDNWCDPANGSGRAFLAALDALAKESGHPELGKAPWALWGHSGGAIWASHMVSRHPARVVAVWARSHAVAEYADAALRVPIVFNYGVREATEFPDVVTASKAAFAKYRPKGAVWAVAVDPKSGHDCRNSRLLALPFFDAMLAARLPKEGTDLRPVPATARVGDPESLAVTDGRQTDVPAGCWLIDDEFGKKWAEYGKTGEVADTTPPAAPTGLTIKPVKGGVGLTWAAAVDPESGLKEFVLYRNGREAKRLRGQRWNYGDEPEGLGTTFSSGDPDGVAGDTYEITAVNHVGLESKKGAAAVVPPGEKPGGR